MREQRKWRAKATVKDALIRPPPRRERFDMTKEQWSKIEDFVEKHDCPKRLRDAGVPQCGKITLEFEWTDFGTAHVVSCERCGEELDVTDYDSF